MMNEALSSIMTPSPYTANPTQSLLTVKELMDKYHIHHVPIVNGDELVGLITTFDLLKLNKPFNSYKNIKIKDVMTTNVATLTIDDKVGTVAEVILANRFHALPIIDKNKKLVGIVSSMDLIKYSFKKEYPQRNSIHERILG